MLVATLLITSRAHMNIMFIVKSKLLNGRISYSNYVGYCV